MQPLAGNGLLSHPHLPRQLQWSLEYWAAATHRRTAVIQIAAHGCSSIVRVLTGSVSDTRAARLCCSGPQDTVKTSSEPSDYMSLSDGETMTTETRSEKKNEVSRTPHFRSGNAGSARMRTARQHTFLKLGLA